MHSWKKLLQLMLVAAVMLALGAAAATASRGFQTEEGGRSAAESREYQIRIGELTITCEVTRYISLHRTISKAALSLAGIVGRVEVRGCRNGTLRVLPALLPWHMQYQSFSGVLPNITGIRMRVIGLGWLIEAHAGLVRCLYVGNVEPELSIVAGSITTIAYREASIRLFETLSLGCPSEMRMTGTLRMPGNVRIRLI